MFYTSGILLFGSADSHITTLAQNGSWPLCGDHDGSEDFASMAILEYLASTDRGRLTGIS